jgi:hypothetical protein
VPDPLTNIGRGILQFRSALKLRAPGNKKARSCERALQFV